MIVSGAIWLGVCVGNIAGPFFFVDDQAPTYGLGIGAILVCVRPFLLPSVPPPSPSVPSVPSYLLRRRCLRVTDDPHRA